MANLNKVLLIGRLTRDPEIRTFGSGGKVAAFGFAVNNRRKNQQTGQWEDEPVYIDVDAFNRGEAGTLADRVEQYLHKGNQAFLEGHLRLDQWTTQDGQKRSKLKLVLDNLQLLEPRADSGSGEGGSRPPRAVSSGPKPAAAPRPAYGGDSFDEPPPESEPPDAGGTGGEPIPF